MKNPAFWCGTTLVVGSLLACSAANRPVNLLPQSMDPIRERDFGDAVEIEGLPSDDEVLAQAAEAVAEAEAALVEVEDRGLPPVTQLETDPVEVGERTPRGASRAGEEVDETLVFIEEEEVDPLEANRLLLASLAERRRRQTAPPAVVVITNKNLAEFAEGGNLTYVEESAAEIDLVPGVDRQRLEEEAYWRSRLRSIRADWRENHELIKELEGQAAELRRRFYSEDDPYVRDGTIKPEWDRALDRLREARQRVEQAQEDLAVALEEGRRAGALPGWLRDGLELEPEPEPVEEMPEADIEEPKVLDPP